MINIQREDMAMIIIYSVCYNQHYREGNNVKVSYPSIGDFLEKANAERVCPSDCFVHAHEVTEEYAERNCEEFISY